MGEISHLNSHFKSAFWAPDFCKFPTGMCITSNSLPTEVPTVELVTTHEKFETLAGDHCADLATYVAKYFCTYEKRFSMFCP